jgi:fatty acid CoA ligase FadD9
MLVPRVAAAVYQHFQSEVVRRSAGVRDEGDRDRIARQVMAEMRGTFLGDRLVDVLIGSAPTPPEVVSFLKECFEIPVIDGYGSTEAGVLTIDGQVDPSVTYKLVDVPELGYRTTDTPYPRGELHVKSEFVSPGFYKNERATKDLFDADGMLNTGDIVEQRAPDRLIWIDRRRNILKLAQGEFVATTRLEGVYASGSPFLEQVFLYGNGLRSYLLAVVVPDAETVRGYFRERGVEPDDAALKHLLREEINRVALAEQLRSYEVPRDFIVEHAPFSVENGLMTDSNKQSRPKLRARYGERLEALYSEIERAQVEELYGLRGEQGEMPIADKVKKAIEVTLGVPSIDPRQLDQSFIQLGGDSLTAVGLETLIEDITGVSVPVGFLLDPTSSMRGVAGYVENALSGKGRRHVTFAEVHQAGAKVVRATDLGIEKFLAPEELEAARSATPASNLPRRAECALLTGANGFLGRFLVLELLERLAATGTRVYAIVRAPSDAAAGERLASTYRTDPALAARFDELSANGRLSVLSGDLMKPQFGLRDDVHARLSEEIDLVVHNGALVNHAFSYENLFEPNVIGTIEAIRFALHRRIKSVSYVSTVGAVSGLDRAEPLREDEDIRVLLPERSTNGGYAAGYATSKWASEVLLHDAHEKLGLPVAVFRPSGIMNHTRYRGQLNVPDFFTRLLAGIVYTGIAPKSFYAPNTPDKRRHYDGTPVDIVARSIAVPSVERREPGRDGQGGYETFHVVNPHHDGISLDVIVHWVTTAGYPVQRITNYDEWYRIFHDRLMALNETQKQHSPLSILQAWQHPQGTRELEFDPRRLLERLRAVSPELAELPHVSEALIHKYLDDMAVAKVVERSHLQLAG